MTQVYVVHTKEWGVEGVFSTKDAAIALKNDLLGYAAYRLVTKTGRDCRLTITSVTLDAPNKPIIDTGL